MTISSQDASEATLREAFVKLLNEEDEIDLIVDVVTIEPPMSAPRLCAFDGHRSAIFRKNQPDVYLLAQRSPMSPPFVEVVGEVKKTSVAAGNEEMGQALSQGFEVFRHQPNRRFLYAFFTNFNVIIYFKIEAREEIARPDPNVPSDFIINMSDTLAFTNADSLQFLMHLMCGSKAERGFVSPPMYQGVDVEECLGSGATSQVWKVKYQSQPLVLKEYLPSFQGLSALWLSLFDRPLIA